MPKITYNDAHPRFDEFVEEHIEDCGVQREDARRWMFLADGARAFIIMGNLVILFDSKFEKPIFDLAQKYELHYSNVVTIECDYHYI